MRGIRQTITYIQYACSNTTIVLMAVLLTAFGAAAIGVQQYASEANVNAAACSDNDIVRCGTHNYGDITRAYDENKHGDVRAIFDHYWIKRTLPAGAQVYDGQANPDGTVTANGRVVAKNASSIGRQAINHSKPIAINGKTYYETSHEDGKAFANPNASLAALVVLDADGNFMYALVKACGNPIYATPVPPPAPEPKEIQVCDLDTKQVVTINEDQFDSSRHSKNLDECKQVNIQVCDLESGKVVTIDEDNFDSNKHSKNLEDCNPKPMEVCNLETNNIVTISETDYDTSKHSKDIEDCKEEPVMLEVCDTEINAIVTVSEETAKDDRYSTNLDDCEVKETPPTETPEEPTPAPKELPTTGAADMFSAVLGLTSMGLAIHYFALSRRS